MFHRSLWVQLIPDQATAASDVAPASEIRSTTRGSTIDTASAEKKLRKRYHRPNLIVVTLDDADVSLFEERHLVSLFPNIRKMISESVTFTNAHVTTPICAPSRYSFLRGQYAHHSGIRVNVDGDDLGNGFLGGTSYFRTHMEHDEISVWLKEAGYHTNVVGKYYQGIKPGHIDSADGWNEARTFLGANFLRPFYFRPNANTNRSGYSKVGFRTDLERQDAVELLQNAAKSKIPFFLYVAPMAPHSAHNRSEPSYPHRLEHLAVGVQQTRDISFNLIDVSGKESAFCSFTRLTKAEEKQTDKTFRNRLLSIIGVDDMIGEMFTTLEASGKLDDTVVMLTSDGGYVVGQYRLREGKQMPTHRVSQAPLFVWGNQFDAGTVDELVMQIDITATLQDLAGISGPAFQDGVSFLPLLHDVHSGPTRDVALSENWHSEVHTPFVYSSLKTKYETYVEWATGEVSYYDRRFDPFFIRNAYDTLSETQQRDWSHALRKEKQRNRAKNMDSSSLTIAEPYASAPFLSPVTNLIGYVENIDSVKEVSVKFQSRDGTRFWNGQEWSTQSYDFVATLANPNGLISKWSLSVSEISNSQFLLFSPDGLTVTVSSEAGDGTTMSARRDFKIDTSRPTLTFSRATPRSVQGLIEDDSVAGRVFVQLKNISTGLFYDGGGWGTSPKLLLARFSAASTARKEWHFAHDFVQGTYYEVTVHGTDAAGNEAEPIVKHFELDGDTHVAVLKDMLS